MYTKLINKVRERHSDPLQSWEHLKDLQIVPKQLIQPTMLRAPRLNVSALWECSITFDCSIVKEGAVCNAHATASRSKVAKRMAVDLALDHLHDLSVEPPRQLLPLTVTTSSVIQSAINDLDTPSATLSPTNISSIGSGCSSSAPLSPTLSLTSIDHILDPPQCATPDTVTTIPEACNVGEIISLKQRRVIDGCQSDMDSLHAMMDSASQSNRTKTVIVTLDVEKEELGHRILEVGLTIVRPGLGVFLAVQLIVEETRDVYNSRFCESHKYSFEFGDVKVLPMRDVLSYVQNTLDEIRSHQGWLVGHSIHCDIGWLSLLGVNFNSIQTCDVANIERWATQRSNPTGLDNMLLAYEVGNCGMAHNAGNDSIATLKVLDKQALAHTGVGIMGLFADTAKDRIVNLLLFGVFASSAHGGDLIK